VCVAPVRQRRALHIFHRQVGQPLRTHPGIVETRNMGMLGCMEISWVFKSRIRVVEFRAARTEPGSLPRRRSCSLIGTQLLAPIRHGIERRRCCC
jgi:hypothetical protein